MDNQGNQSIGERIVNNPSTDWNDLSRLSFAITGIANELEKLAAAGQRENENDIHLFALNHSHAELKRIASVVYNLRIEMTK